VRARPIKGTGRHGSVLVLVGALALGSAGCDDQVKYISWFETMTQQPAVETYEAPASLPPEGTVPVGAVRTYTLAEADTALTNPLAPTAEVLERGEVLYVRFCLPCHGDTGAGDGPVIGPNRLPPLPTLNLLSERAMNELSDGYIWGMIANGRGVMPAYRRIPHEDRWPLVTYVRSLQAAAAGEAAGTAANQP
jgi:mono/diheme cytochrome c family protein